MSALTQCCDRQWGVCGGTLLAMVVMSPEAIAAKLLKKKKNEILKEMLRRKGVTPLNHIREHDKQLALTLCNLTNRWFMGGNRTGKTEWNAHEIARFLHKRHPVIDLSGPKYKGKNIEGWSACPSFDVQEETTQPKILACLDPNRILNVSRLRGDIMLKLQYKADDGTTSTLNFKSYEQGRAKFQGAGKNFVSFDEEPPFDVYEEAIMRSQAGFPLYTWCSMTPVNGMTWVYNDVYLRTDDPRLKLITASWKDNCFLTEEQMEEMTSRFTEDALMVRRDGLFVQRVGLVCSWFNRSAHLKDNIMEMIPKGSDVYSGTDFGFSKPCAHVFVAVDSDDNHYIFDGFYKTFLQNPQIADLIKRKEKAIQEAGLVMRTRYADSAQPSDIAELTTMGVPMIPVKKETGESLEGWDEHRARRLDLQGRIQPGTGKPKLFISSALVEVDEKARKGDREYNWMLKEVENLRWDEIRQSGRMFQKPRWSDKNEKHAIDAYTYMATMYAAPPESAEAAAKRRRDESRESVDVFEDEGWVA